MRFHKHIESNEFNFITCKALAYKTKCIYNFVKKQSNYLKTKIMIDSSHIFGSVIISNDFIVSYVIHGNFDGETIK